MSGERDFNAARFVDMASYFVHLGGLMPPSKLAWLMMHADFRAYQVLGHSLSGATYLKGREHPEVAEVGVGWFEWAIRDLKPWWARAGGWLVTAYLVGKTLRARAS